MSRLGQILLERGWITREQLRAALRNQQILGGRLGSCLLEMDAVSEEILLEALSQATGSPAPPPGELASIPDEVVGLLPARLAVRYSAVPFRAFSGHVDVAMLDTGNLEHQDELAFGLGKRIQVHVAPEVRLRGALARYYGADLPDRFAQILRRLDRDLALQAGNLTPEVARDALSWGDDDLAALGGDRRPRPADEDDALEADLALLRGEAGASPAPDAPGGATATAPPADPVRAADAPAGDGAEAQAPETRAAVAPPPSATDGNGTAEAGGEASGEASGEAPPLVGGDGRAELVAAAEERLARAESAGEIGRALLAALDGQFRRTVLLRVRHGTAQGWMGRGPGIEEDRLSEVSVDLDRASVLRELDAGTPVFAGRLEASAEHRRLAAAWGGGLDHEALLVPIRLAQRLVCVIYGDRGEEGVKAVDTPHLHVLVARAAAAFQRLIARHRERPSGDPRRAEAR